MNNKKAVAIVVGGGPAPGINGVISAATIEAINRGHKVYGIRKGFHHLCKGDLSNVNELGIKDVSRIDKDGGSILATSRANPKKSVETLNNVVNALKKLEVGYLVTIGGDDTASSAQAIAKAVDGTIAVGHVPKTIDNDLPLPGAASTFGFQSARERGVQIIETLMEDAKTTERWYLVIAMGRKAGHLALGIGISAGATLTVIPEEFGDRQIHLSELIDIITGSMLKRIGLGRSYGVVVLAEGLAEKLDVDSIPELANVERDPHGNIRFAELDFGRIVKNALRSRLAEFGIDMLAVDKNVGYELRCCPPVAFDREYTRQLGFGVIDNLLMGKTEFMISRQGDRLLPMPFSDFIDPKTGRSAIRMVDINSSTYQVALEYMIRLTAEDLERNELMQKISLVTNMHVNVLRDQFKRVVSAGGRGPKPLVKCLEGA